MNTVLENADVDVISLVSLSTNLASLTTNVDEMSSATATAAISIALSILKSANDVNAAYTDLSKLLSVVNNAAIAILKNNSVNSTEQADTFNFFTSLVLKQNSAGENAFCSLLSNLRFEAKVTTSIDNDGALYTLEPPLTSLEANAGISNNNISFNLGNKIILTIDLTT